jgi:NuA3 HAT complex component NTO1
LPTSGKGVTNATNVGDVEMEDVDQIKSTHVGSAITSSHTPPDSNGYQAAPEHRQPPPPTPPLSNGSAIGAVDLESDARDFLTDGGKPWYLKSQFEIDGTNVKELQWTGRDIVRSMSEELTDIDDEELKDMGEEMEGIQLAAAEPVLEEKTLEVPKSAKKPKARKRWRGFR